MWFTSYHIVYLHRWCGIYRDGAAFSNGLSLDMITCVSSLHLCWLLERLLFMLEGLTSQFLSRTISKDYTRVSRDNPLENCKQHCNLRRWTFENSFTISLIGARDDDSKTMYPSPEMKQRWMFEKSFTISEKVPEMIALKQRYHLQEMRAWKMLHHLQEMRAWKTG